MTKRMFLQIPCNENMTGLREIFQIFCPQNNLKKILNSQFKNNNNNFKKNRWQLKPQNKINVSICNISMLRRYVKTTWEILIFHSNFNHGFTQLNIKSAKTLPSHFP